MLPSEHCALCDEGWMYDLKSSIYKTKLKCVRQDVPGSTLSKYG